MAQAKNEGRNELFTKTAAQFVHCLRSHASVLGFADRGRIGSHALRRGIARDIIDAGGSLATLLRAGDWRSGAFAAYLRENQAQDVAVSNVVIDHLESE